MSKAKKGLLTAGSVLTIIGTVLAIILACVIIFVGSKLTAEFIVEIFRSAPETYTYETNYYYQGEFYDYVIINHMAGEIFLPETIELTATMFASIFKVLGFIVFAFAAVKLILAIVALAKSGKTFAKGTVITLVVFSFLTLSILEGALLIAALCVKNKKPEVQPVEETATVA